MTEPIRVGIQDDAPDNPNTVLSLVGNISILDELREDLELEVEIENLYLDVPNRQTIRMVYRPAFDLDALKKWRIASRIKRHKADSEIDQKKFFYIVLAETCVGLQLKRKATGEWVDVSDPNTGQPWTFKTGALSEYLKVVPGWYATVEAMYKNDGHIVMTANAIMDAAGFGNYDIESGEDGPLDS